MSELKVYVKPLKTNVLGQTIVGQSYYLKSEADKVIAELKAQKAQAEDDCAYWKMNEGNAANAMHETEEYAMQLYRSDRHNKYKRCLAMAECRDAQSRLFHRFGSEVMLRQLYGRNPAVDMEQMDRRSSRCRLASQLWKKRAEEFKEEK